MRSTDPQARREAVEAGSPSPSATGGRPQRVSPPEKRCAASPRSDDELRRAFATVDALASRLRAEADGVTASPAARRE